MADVKDFREDMQRIGGLVQEIEAIADPAVNAKAKELVQSLMGLHGSGLDRLLEIVADSEESGIPLIDRLGRDPRVSGLMVLHGLHPDPPETRVLKAVDRIGPTLRKQGCEVEVLSVSENGVHLRVKTGEHSCGSTAKTVQALLQDAIYEAAPDIESINIDGLDGKAASGFVGLGQLLGAEPGLAVTAGRDGNR